VLALKLAGGQWAAVGLAIGGEQPDGVGVGLDGVGALVLGARVRQKLRLRARRCVLVAADGREAPVADGISFPCSVLRLAE
jgi:hypothetical protein